ncbi:MAG: DNA recombination protein RmuC [bacterium]
MDIFSIILLVIVVAGFACIIWLLGRRPKVETDDKSMLLLQNQMSEMNKTMDSKLGDSTKQTMTVIRDMIERVTELKETNKQVVGFADQLQRLQDILQSPKQRGVLGEYYLETVLKNVLPPKTYQMQYRFKDGETVDAVVFVKDKISPIDSKFSLENYNRIVVERDEARKVELEKNFMADLKNRINETAKYIRPDEKTMDFAFMFIPSEGIFYDLLINQVGTIKSNSRDLIEYAFKEKRVIIVSPTSFLAYLQTVLQGLRALQIEEKAQDIIKEVEKLNKHMKSTDEYFQKLGNNLKTVFNMYNSTYKEFGKVNKDVIKIAEVESEIEVKELAKPE